MDFDLFFN